MGHLFQRKMSTKSKVRCNSFYYNYGPGGVIYVKYILRLTERAEGYRSLASVPPLPSYAAMSCFRLPDKSLSDFVIFVIVIHGNMGPL